MDAKGSMLTNEFLSVLHPETLGDVEDILQPVKSGCLAGDSVSWWRFAIASLQPNERIEDAREMSK